MDAKLTIKYDYLVGREDPAQVFEAISLYMQSYKDFAALMSEALGICDDFSFKLDEVDKGSIKSMISACKNAYDGIENIIYEQGNKLFGDLVDEGETKTEQQVDELAEKLEFRLSKAMKNKMAEPYVNRKKLAVVIKSFSEANKLTHEGEAVSVLAGNDEFYEEFINKGWVFSGNPDEMFLGERTKVNTVLKMNAVTTVCEGSSAWTFKCINLEGRRISANVLDKKWLERYQLGMIYPIGPMDIITADVEYTVIDLKAKKRNAEIKNAKIKKILDIKRFQGHQYGL